MATEKLIHGKHDNGHHDGLASNMRRLQASDYELKQAQEPTCFWKTIYENPDSTSGIDMQNNPNLDCGECDGSHEIALELGCRYWMQKPLDKRK